MSASAKREETRGLLEWLPEFFRHELAPYPGRFSLVARMVIAAVLSMLIIVTFRIPYGSIGVNCAFILSRENLRATAKSGIYFILAFAAWVALMPIGARMFASIPITHFLWEAVTVFLCFFFLRTITYFPLAAGIAVVATGTLAIWYLPGPAELNVELSLWQILATAIGVVVTLLVEVVFHYFSSEAPLQDGIATRLRCVEELSRAYGSKPLDQKVVQPLTQYAMTGVSALHQQVERQAHNAFERAQWNALISAVDRAVDICAALATEETRLLPADERRLVEISEYAAAIRKSVVKQVHLEAGMPTTLASDSPLMTELEDALRLMGVILQRPSEVMFLSQSSKHAGPTNVLLASDAFSNPEYLRFSLAGTAAAMLCYIIYVGLNWPGIATAVTTCILTALSDIGSSRQKQILRIGGAAVGGFVFGLGSQIFILPYVDSIVGLTITLAVATGLSAYVATSSARLSYAGLQMAFAFYLINVTDFSLSTDLTIGRDRAVGVLLGIGAMWLVFEKLYRRPAAIQMVSGLARTLRLIASLKDAVAEKDSAHLSALRDQIAASLASVSSEADAVLFETGRERVANLVAREHVRTWLLTLRTIYLLTLPLLPDGVRSQDSGSEQLLPEEYGQLLARSAEALEEQLSIAVAARTGATRRFVRAAVPEMPSRTPHEASAYPTGHLMRLMQDLERDITRTSIFETKAGIGTVAPA